MLHEPIRAVRRQSICLHAVQHGGVSCMELTNPPLALSGHAWQFRAEPLCSVKRRRGRGVRGATPPWRVGQSTRLRTVPCPHQTHDECCPLAGRTLRSQKGAPAGWGVGRVEQSTGLHTVPRPHKTHYECCPLAGQT